MSTSDSEFFKWNAFWKWMELGALVVGLAGSAVLCLANYDWHWFRESIFFMTWSAAPFVLAMMANPVSRRLVRSPLLRPITAGLSMAMTFQSLMAYIGAVRHPHHSSGMVFVAIPLCWMLVFPAILTLIVLAFIALKKWIKP